MSEYPDHGCQCPSLGWTFRFAKIEDTFEHGGQRMGYTTTFTGSITVTPPLNRHEIAYLRRFGDSRRMDRERGPYYCGPAGGSGRRGDDKDGRDDEYDVRDHNHPDSDQPGLWCKWEPADDGTAIAWNGAEKFYDAEKWMAYLILAFLKPDAWLASELKAPREDRYYAPEFEHFTFDHVLNGVIDAQGEEEDDIWQLAVTDNIVTVRADGEEEGPITDTSPLLSADQIQLRVFLAGGPDDGHRLRVALGAVNDDLVMPSGAVYRTGDQAGPRPVGSDGCAVMWFREG